MKDPSKIKVLVACEESQRVCMAFRERGFEAYSCDIQEPSGGHPEWHILGDALKAVEAGNITTMDCAEPYKVRIGRKCQNCRRKQNDESNCGYAFNGRRMRICRDTLT